SAVGPHPYPAMVRAFQAIIGQETRDQVIRAEAALPRAVVACIGGGSNAIGIVTAFIDDEVDLYGVEASGEGLDGRHAATLSAGTPGVLHGALSYLLQDENGQVELAHSISAGLDYPGVGPEHAHLKETGRVKYVSASDEQALEGVRLLSESEGIIPALETAHAVSFLSELAPSMHMDEIVILNCSGRGDKDMETISKHLR
ncbi:MAG: pyridoxal-phosphate dependent enzyme, partial [Rhodothermales bacterium]|nr:pyridoxal-phosphate dependent enzyme [Rhodothermales bacterium]